MSCHSILKHFGVPVEEAISDAYRLLEELAAAVIPSLVDRASGIQ
jgi:hypothetical protein